MQPHVCSYASRRPATPSSATSSRRRSRCACAAPREKNPKRNRSACENANDQSDAFRFNLGRLPEIRLNCQRLWRGDWSYLLSPRFLDGPPFSTTVDTRLPLPRLSRFRVDLHNDCASCNDLIAILLFFAADQEKREKHA